MTALQLIGFIVSLIARVMLLLYSISFLAGSLAFSFLVYELWVIKSEHKDELVSVSSYSSPKINFYLVALALAAVYLIAYAVYAIYLAILSRQQGLKSLMLLSSITFTAGFVVFALTSPGLETFNNEISARLREYQALYDWDHQDGPVVSQEKLSPLAGEIDPRKRATLVWDLVQETLHCCGLRNSADWAQYKPDKLKTENVFPVTCCEDLTAANTIGQGYCPDSFLRWNSPCSDTVHEALTYVLGIVGDTIYFGLLSTLLSGIILLTFPYEADYYESYGHGPNIYQTGRPYPNTINQHSGLITSKCHYNAPKHDGNYGSY